MFEKRRTGLFAATLLVAGAMAMPVMAAGNDQSTDPDARHVLSLVDQAKSGKVSRQEYMTAMGAEYNKLAPGHDSADAADTTAPRIRTSSAPHR
jgi:hypothetical protein